MTDDVNETLILAAHAGKSSLRAHCNDRGELLFILALPKTVKGLTDPTMIEVRFDKNPSKSYGLSAVTQDVIVKAIGGAPDAQNFVLGTIDMSDIEHMHAAQFSAASLEFLQALPTATRMVYRLPLANAGPDNEGEFTVAGFSSIRAKLTGKCKP